MGEHDVRDPDPRPLDSVHGLVLGARNRRRWHSVALAVEPTTAPTPGVEYRWDADTEILAASIAERRGGAAAATAVQLEGRDGSWVTLELRAGRFAGVEIAVWPRIRVHSALAPPPAPERGHVVLPAAHALGGNTDVEVDAALLVNADRRGRTFHLRVGRLRPTRAVRVARGILVEIDASGALGGLWLLDVPPITLPS